VDRERLRHHTICAHLAPVRTFSILGGSSAAVERELCSAVFYLLHTWQSGSPERALDCRFDVLLRCGLNNKRQIKGVIGAWHGGQGLPNLPGRHAHKVGQAGLPPGQVSAQGGVGLTR